MVASITVAPGLVAPGLVAPELVANDDNPGEGASLHPAVTAAQPRLLGRRPMPGIAYNANQNGNG